MIYPSCSGGRAINWQSGCWRLLHILCALGSPLLAAIPGHCHCWACTPGPGAACLLSCPRRLFTELLKSSNQALAVATLGKLWAESRSSSVLQDRLGHCSVSPNLGWPSGLLAELQLYTTTCLAHLPDFVHVITCPCMSLCRSGGHIYIHLFKASDPLV